MIIMSTDENRQNASGSFGGEVRTSAVPLPPFFRSGSRYARPSRGKNVGENGWTLTSFASSTSFLSNAERQKRPVHPGSPLISRQISPASRNAVCQRVSDTQADEQPNFWDDPVNVVTRGMTDDQETGADAGEAVCRHSWGELPGE